MRPHLSSTDAERVLCERYPDLFDRAGEAPALLAAAGLAFLAADLRAAELGTRPVRPVTRMQLDAAMVLSRSAADGAEYAELLVTAHLRATGATWQDIADLRGGYTHERAASNRFARLRKKFGLTDTDLPTPPTLAAYTARAARYIEAATAGRTVSPFLARTAAEVLGALLLAARYGQATGADLRTWAEDPVFAGASDGLAHASPDEAEAAHQVLADTAALPVGTRADITAVVLAGIDQWDPPGAQDRP